MARFWMKKATSHREGYLVLALVLTIVLATVFVFFNMEKAFEGKRKAELNKFYFNISQIPPEESTGVDEKISELKKELPLNVSCSNLRLAKGMKLRSGDVTIEYGGNFFQAGGSLESALAKFIFTKDNLSEVKYLASKTLEHFDGIDIFVDIVAVSLPPGGKDEVVAYIFGLRDCQLLQ